MFSVEWRRVTLGVLCNNSTFDVFTAVVGGWGSALVEEKVQPDEK
jgi:hypothetical protein